jgi:hypothetical protein
LLFIIDNFFTSFQRQLSLYGFRRASADKGFYYHPNFIQNRRDLVSQMTDTISPRGPLNAANSNTNSATTSNTYNNNNNNNNITYTTNLGYESKQVDMHAFREQLIQLKAQGQFATGLKRKKSGRPSKIDLKNRLLQRRPTISGHTLPITTRTAPDKIRSCEIFSNERNTIDRLRIDKRKKNLIERSERIKSRVLEKDQKDREESSNSSRYGLRKSAGLKDYSALAQDWSESEFEGDIDYQYKDPRSIYNHQLLSHHEQQEYYSENQGKYVQNNNQYNNLELLYDKDELEQIERINRTLSSYDELEEESNQDDNLVSKNSSYTLSSSTIKNDEDDNYYEPGKRGRGRPASSKITATTLVSNIKQIHNNLKKMSKNIIKSRRKPDLDFLDLSKPKKKRISIDFNIPVVHEDGDEYVSSGPFHGKYRRADVNYSNARINYIDSNKEIQSIPSGSTNSIESGDTNVIIRRGRPPNNVINHANASITSPSIDQESGYRGRNLLQDVKTSRIGDDFQAIIEPYSETNQLIIDVNINYDSDLLWKGSSNNNLSESDVINYLEDIRKEKVQLSLPLGTIAVCHVNFLNNNDYRLCCLVEISLNELNETMFNVRNLYNGIIF